MRRSIMLASAVSLAIAASAPAFSQGAPQTVTLMKVDPQTLATGYRTSKVVGATVVNEANETVGTIDDLIVTPCGQAPYAVLSVGGFLGLGTKYVVVPFMSLKIIDKKMVLPGGTKDALKALPEFRYDQLIYWIKDATRLARGGASASRYAVTTVTPCHAAHYRRGGALLPGRGADHHLSSSIAIPTGSNTSRAQPAAQEATALAPSSSDHHANVLSNISVRSYEGTLPRMG